MKKDICFFLPTRKGSQRVKSKNTRPFAGIEGGILELKLRQLIKSERLSSVVLSTNDELSMEIAKQIDPSQEKIKVVQRPDRLCLDTTVLTDLIKYVPEIIPHQHILWGHTTTPFVTGADYDAGIDSYFSKLEEGYDSLIGVMPLQNFLLDSHANVFNYDAGANRWPRTQDLPILYEVNHAMFITSRDIYIKDHNRVGAKPFLYEQDKIKSFDIDWVDDFLIAEAIYDKLFKV
ncbi:cytidylyltransferase domain-containing protein [Chryseolinea soli]|uniref:Acylneuraminate cytidylyltransferase family protein n=1 Tax=Chryseolinea soli TaxID=2321403 RepID=A0A385SSI5_9BACT|nr:acylneuraminate cytidylyltransferase family protein [Chryseolinea soli]AYB33107.1 acylneuraminate cytidylyltransferase family protein [Chryseolinea soli]